MKLKHTQGPWGYSRTHTASSDYWYVITHHGGYGPIVDAGGRDLSGQIAEAKHLVTDQKEIEANARLIASAPEMLEMVIEYYLSIPDIYRNEEIAKSVRVLIEKATGLSIKEVLSK
jgi:hypothetical protein